MRSLLVLLSLVTLPAFADGLSGEAVYNSTCIECHGTGKDKAPVFANKQAWGKLVKEGLNDLVPAALNGIRKMPAKGGNAALSDMEVARGVVYMANAGGGKFAEPSSEDVARWRAKADKKKRKAA
jgi:cytochrome c5